MKMKDSDTILEAKRYLLSKDIEILAKEEDLSGVQALDFSNKKQTQVSPNIHSVSTFFEKGTQ